MKPVRSSYALAALGLCLGVGSGVFFYWRAADGIAATRLRLRAEANAPRPEKGWDFWTIEIDNLTSELKGEREKIRTEYTQLEQRASQLASERQELERLRAELEQTRQEISNRVVEIGADELRNLRTLSQSYSAMTPKAAVAIMREMEELTVVKILSLMKPEVVSQIFDEMARTADSAHGSQAKRAAALSERLRLLKATKTSGL